MTRHRLSRSGAVQHSRWAAAAVSISAAVLSASCGSASTAVNSPAHPSGPCSPVSAALCDSVPPATNVRAAAMINSAAGWALTANALSMTRDGGHSWQSIDPPGVVPTNVWSVQFTNADDGWVVSSADGVRLIVDRTVDGATTWTQIELPMAASDQFLQRVYADFAGPDGWIVVDRGLTATSTASIYVTANAGRTFRVVPMRTAAEVRFMNADDGFTLGDSTSPGVYSTQNGGVAWHPVMLPPPSGVSSVTVEASAPDQTTSPSNLLAVTLRDPTTHGVEGFAIYSTLDGARSFHLNGAVEFRAGLSLGVGIPNSEDVVAVTGQNSGDVITYSSTDGGLHFHRAIDAAVTGMLTGPTHDNDGVGAVSFVGASVGWALAYYQACLSSGMAGPADCHSKQLLWATSDSGASWSLLSPT